MFQLKNIHQIFAISLLLLVYRNSDAQFATKVTDYLPAPGQYTNAEYIGTPAAAGSVAGTNRGMICLGAFGGSITLYFATGIQNDPANPYGVDFTIYGNSTMTWSEPGIIQVMKDENKNGIPDDTWYEIAGSDHYWNSTLFSYEVTYANSGLNHASNIYWSDNQGKTGIIPANSFHQQPYYPKSDLFPVVAPGHFTLKGTRISGHIDLSNPGEVNSYHRAFGYADNTPVLSASEKLPDNPYSTEIEGSGGDAIDIGWAVDSNLKPVKLDEIHFVRVYTGMNALVGWLGEISTEIAGIRDVEPATVSGSRSMVVIQDLPLKIMIGQALDLNALVFESGIPEENASLIWTLNNPELAAIENTRLLSKKPGKLLIRAASRTNSSVYAEKELELFTAGKALITLQSPGLKVNDKIELSGKFTDQNGTVLTGLTPSWRIGNELIAKIIQADGKYYLKGKQTGKSWLYLEASGIKTFRDSLLVEVFPESARKRVYISVKTIEKTILPRQSVWVDQSDLTPAVDHPQKLYGLQEISFVSLAHAVASALKSNGLSSDWAFRDDAEGGSMLYLWKVPENEGGSTGYHFGYGGSRTSEAHRKTWVVMLNQQPYVSGFDKVKVNNNDEILIYHLTDNSLPWTVSQLTLGIDSVNANQQIELLVRKYACSMDNNRLISVNSSEIIANQSLGVEQKNQSTIKLTTDEYGKASFIAEKSGEYLVSSGIDAAKLVVSQITGIRISLKNKFKCIVYPNPFTESIRIDSPFPVSSIGIFNPEGKLVYTGTDSTQDISLGSLAPGLYILRFWAGNQAFQQKIIKKSGL